MYKAAKIYKSTQTSVLHDQASPYDIISYDQEIFDNADFHSTSTNPERLTIPEDGYYLIDACNHFDGADAGGGCETFIMKNSSTWEAIAMQGRYHYPVGNKITLIDYFTAGDYLDFHVYQSSGLTKTIPGSTSRQYASIAKFETNVACLVSNSGNQGLSGDSAWNQVNFQQEQYDTHNMHDTVTNNTRITIPENGFYHIWGCGGFGNWGVSQYYKRFRFRLNGDTPFGGHGDGNAASIARFTVDCIKYLNKDDYVEFQAKTYETGNYLVGGTTWSAKFGVHKLV
jgi:hypothetical protein